MGFGDDITGGFVPRELFLRNVTKIRASNISAAITDCNELYVWGVK